MKDIIIKTQGDSYKGCFMRNEFSEIDNPYTLQFSYIPPQFIERTSVTNEIVDNFVRNVPTYRGMFITGVRGTGKTVMLGDIRNKISSRKDWIAVDINPESDLLDSLARGLYLIPEIKSLFVKAKIDFSVLGIGVHLENAEIVASNAEDALAMMLRVLKKAKKRLLVTIDEVTYSKDVARFSHALSSYASADYDIYVLMTGLLDNIKAIKNNKSLTFLYRAKVMELETLNITAICKDYEDTLKLDRERAEKLAFATRGYSLAFQAVGFHFWNALSKKKTSEIDENEIYRELDVTLAELAYSKICDELSANDLKVLYAMAHIMEETGEASIKVEKIREETGMTSDTFTTYRKRLMESGIVNGKTYGYLRILLPRFERYLRFRNEW